MKKQKMIRACVCLSIVMLIQLCPTYASEEAITDSQIQQLISLQERAVAANDNINNGMGFNNDGSIDYEDDFAGAEIIGDKLVISLVDCSEATKEKYLEWAAEYADAVEFEQAEYAYNYLFEQADEVVEALYEETGVLSQGCVGSR